MVQADSKTDCCLVSPRLLELDVNRISMGNYNVRSVLHYTMVRCNTLLISWLLHYSSQCAIGSDPYRVLENVGLRTVFIVRKQPTVFSTGTTTMYMYMYIQYMLQYHHSQLCDIIAEHECSILIG